MAGLLLGLTAPAQARFLAHYGLNWSSFADASEEEESSNSQMFHRLFLAGSTNGKQTLFLGWNINSWSREAEVGTDTKTSYGVTEMGPRLQWFVSDQYNLYFALEWNPYLKGTRKLAGTSRDISGSSFGGALGYRFKVSRSVGLGVSLNYHSIALAEEKIGSDEQDVTDKLTFMMPMLELSMMFR